MIRYISLFVTLLLCFAGEVFAAGRAVPAEYGSAAKIELTRKIASGTRPLASNERTFSRYEGSIYRLSYADLVSTGVVPSSVDPRTFRMFNNGNEIALYVYGESDGSFSSGDYIEFYGTGHTETRYTYTNPYWLVWGAGNGARMGVRTSFGGPARTTYPFVLHHELNQQHQAHLGLNEPWVFSDYCSISLAQDPNDNTKAIPAPSGSHVEKSYVLTAAGRSTADGLPAQLKLSLPMYGVALKAGDPFEYRLTVTWVESANASNSLELSPPGGEVITQASPLLLTYAIPAGKIFGGTGANTVKIKLTKVSGGFARPLVFLDWVELTYRRSYTATAMVTAGKPGRVLAFSTEVAGDQNLVIANVDQDTASVLDITDPLRPVKVTVPANARSGTVMTVPDSPPVPSKYVFATENAISTNASELVVKSATFPALDSAQNDADYIAIMWGNEIPDTFEQNILNKLTPLFARRESQGLSVKVVKLCDIYNVFNYGLPSPYAVKTFLRYAYEHWTKKPSYLLIAGDANYDFRLDGTVDTSYTRQVPTFMAENSVAEDPGLGYTGSDEWFACFDGDDDVLPEMMVGRLPFSTETDALNMVTKTISFEQTPPEDTSSKRVVLVSGGEARFDETTASLQARIPGDYTVGILRATNGFDATFKNTLLTSLNVGALVMNYSGHGAIRSWGVTAGDAASNPTTLSAAEFTALASAFTATKRYSLWVALSCYNGYILRTNSAERSFAEELLSVAGKGPAAMFAASGVSTPSYQKLMAEGFFDALFVKKDRVLGAAVLRAKKYLLTNADVMSVATARAFMLFGDPALIVPTGEVIDVNQVTAPQILAEAENVPDAVHTVDLILPAQAGGSSSGVSTPSSGNANASEVTPDQSGSVTFANTTVGSMKTNSGNEILSAVLFEGKSANELSVATAPKGTSLLSPRSETVRSAEKAAVARAASDALRPRDEKGHFKADGLQSVKSTDATATRSAPATAVPSKAWYARIGDMVVGLLSAIWHLFLRWIGFA